MTRWTETLAILGAITGVIGTLAGVGALGWDVYKWRTSGRPRLRISVGGPLVSNDPRDDNEYYSVIVTNHGDRATTISALTYRYWKKKPLRIWKAKPDERGVINTFAIHPPPFPKKLDVGEEWRHLHPLGEKFKMMAKDGYLLLEVVDSFAKNDRDYSSARLLIR